jgi:sugar phosphate isomerase/epimerase
MKIGLKLWSTNTDHYLREAKRLYEDGVFDYIELYMVPGTSDTSIAWKELSIPFVVHAPHSAHGVNLADPESQVDNCRIFDEVKVFSDRLGVEKIIVHGGVLGRVDEIVRQLKIIGDSRVLIENKPYFPVDGSRRLLAGSTPEEVQYIMNDADCGFCFDVGHAVASANAHGAKWRDYFESFTALSPDMFHISDIDVTSTIDQHLHFGEGTLPLTEIIQSIRSDSMVSIETAKNSIVYLDDFKGDAQWLSI